MGKVINNRRFEHAYEARDFFGHALKMPAPDAMYRATQVRLYGQDWASARTDRIESYHTRYSLVSHLSQYRADDLKYGIELEIACYGVDEVEPVAIHQAARDTIGAGIIRLEFDGSVSNGCEIIFAPMTAQDLKNKRVAMYKFLRALRQLGYVSHKGGQCGLHVHITRRSSQFADVVEDIVLFDNKVKTFWRTFSRRTEQALNSYCKLQRQRNDNRYHAVNKSTLASSTVELRHFRGTLKPASFFACLDAAIAIGEYAKSVCVQSQVNESKKRVKGSWRNFVRYVHQSGRYPWLCSYVAERMDNDWTVDLKHFRRSKRTKEEIARAEREREEKKMELLRTQVSKQNEARRRYLDMFVRPDTIPLGDLSIATTELTCVPLLVDNAAALPARIRQLNAVVSRVTFVRLPYKAVYLRARYKPSGWGTAARIVSRNFEARVTNRIFVQEIHDIVMDKKPFIFRDTSYVNFNMRWA